jgi:plasmid maintenance system antidote protein VapI
MIKKNIEFKKKLLDLDISQRAFAEKLGIHESRLSMIINGRYNLSDIEQAQLAEAVGCRPSEIFQDA